MVGTNGRVQVDTHAFVPDVDRFFYGNCRCVVTGDRSWDLLQVWRWVFRVYTDLSKRRDGRVGDQYPVVEEEGGPTTVTGQSLVVEVLPLLDPSELNLLELSVLITITQMDAQGFDTNRLRVPTGTFRNLGGTNLRGGIPPFGDPTL